MNIDITPENILTQLGYNPSENALSQVKNIINNTKNFDKFSKHIFSLNDEIKHIGGFVAMSNSNDYFKIKLNDSSSEMAEEFKKAVDRWSQKYKVQIQKVENKNTYYIIGQK